MKTMRSDIPGRDNAAGQTCLQGQAVNRFAKVFVLSVSLTGLGAWGGNANAATCTSTAAGGNWNAQTTWGAPLVGCVGALLGIPGAGDNVIIATTGAGAVTVNVQASMTNLTVNAGSTLTIQGGSNFRIRPTGTTSISGTLNLGTSTSSSRFTGLVTVAATGTWNNAGNQAVTFRGGITNNGTFFGGTGTQTFDTNNQTINGTSPINFGGAVTVSGARTITNTNTAGVTIAGNLTGTNTASTWVNGANSILNYGGTATPMGTRVFTASAVGNTVNYSGAAQTVDLPTGSTYYHLTLSGSGIKTMPATAMSVLGNFTMSGTATTTAAAALTVGMNFTIGTGTTFNAGAFNHTVSGNFGATGTLNPGTGTVTLNGAAAQTISGTSPVGFNNLTVTNATNPNITLATNVTVAGTLTGTVTLTPTCPIDYTLTSTVPAQVLHSCLGPDHILITHAGTALTCSPQTVTITACANAACTVLYSGGANVTLTPGGQTFVIDATGVNSAATVQQSAAGTATLSAASLPAATYTCWNTATLTASCAMTFSDSGFVVTVPNHTSCANATATVEAVQKAPGTGRCVPAYKGVTRAVNLYSGYANPVSGTQVITASTGTVSTAAPGTAHNLAFDANGTATITLSYPDAGQLTLTAGDTAPTGAAMTGSSTFVVAPASFAFSGISAAPLKAGQAFNATVTAMNACATPAATPNFGQETTPEGVTVSFTKCQPTGAGSSNGLFSGNVGAFTSGVATANNLNWSEVGNGDLVATLTSGSYLGSGLTATGNTGTGGTTCNGTGGAGNVGRFIPDHFDTTVAASRNCTGLNFASACPGNSLAYSGQRFSVNVYAMNANGVHTQNYAYSATPANNFARDVTLSAVSSSGGAVSGAGTLTSGALMASSDFGVAFGTTNKTVFTFSALPTGPTDIFIRAVDTDMVSSLRTVAANSVEGGLKVVSGRIKFANAYGSELLPLSIAITLQYYNGTSWVITSNDSVSTINSNLSTAGGNIVATIISGLTGGVSVISPGPVTFANGAAVFRLAQPGIAGVVDLTIPALSGVDCNGVVPTPVGCFWPGAAGRATFGVYKGNNSYIYRRESY